MSWNWLKKIRACFSRKSNAPAMVEAFENRRLMAASYDLGMNINDSGSDIVKPGTAVMKDLGVKTVRVWVGVSDFNSHSMNDGLRRAIDYSNQGFDVLAVVSPNGGKIPSASAVSGWFDWATSNSTIKRAVDRWEIGNEVDHYSYWRGTAKQYVTGFLAPAANAIHSNGGTVISAGPSWDPEDVREMINYGMLNYVDYVGFHPYATGVSVLKQRIAQLEDIVGGRKPIAATEWNIRGYEGDKTAWASAVKDAFPIIKANFDINYYFGLVNTNATKAGPGGIMYSSGAKTSFYNSIASGMGSSGLIPSSLPAITKVSVYNADTDKLLVDSLTNGATLNLRSFGTGNLTFVAAGANGTSSVKFTYDGSSRVDNDSPYTAFGSSGTNLLGKGISIGAHSLKVQAYSANNATGRAGVARNFTFAVVNLALTTPKVSGFKIINNVTGATISGYANVTANTTIRLSSLPTRNISVVAITSSTESVKFNTFGNTIIESTAPYNALGDPNGKHVTWSLKAGTYTFSATPFSANNATGTAGSTKTVKFTFV